MADPTVPTTAPVEEAAPQSALAPPPRTDRVMGIPTEVDNNFLNVLLNTIPIVGQARMQRQQANRAASARQRQEITNMIIRRALEKPEEYAIPEVRQSIEGALGPAMGKEFAGIIGGVARGKFERLNAWNKLVAETGGNHDAAADLALVRGVPIPDVVEDYQARRAMMPAILTNEESIKTNAEVERQMRLLPGAIEAAVRKGMAQTDVLANRQEVLRPGQAETAATVGAAGEVGSQTARQPFEVAREQRATAVAKAEERRKRVASAQDDLAKAEAASVEALGSADQLDAYFNDLAGPPGQPGGAIAVLATNPSEAVFGIQALKAAFARRASGNPEVQSWADVKAAELLTPILVRMMGDPRISDTDRQIVKDAVLPTTFDSQASAYAKVASARRVLARYRKAIKAPLDTQRRNVQRLSRSESTTPTTGGPGATIATRTNNPGNIKDGEFARSQPGYTGTGPAAQDGGRFATFDSPASGTQAMGQLLRSPAYRGMTIDRAMRKWSNSGYGGDVASSVGIDPARRVGELSEPELAELTQSMARREGFQGAMAPAPAPSPAPAPAAPAATKSVAPTIAPTPVPAAAAQIGETPVDPTEALEAAKARLRAAGFPVP